MNIDSEHNRLLESTLTKMDPATICEEDHKLATVCLIKHSGLRDSDSVQNKIVRFKSVFSFFFFFLFFFFCRNCIFCLIFCVISFTR